jgi:hypothetical protein
MNGRTTPRRCHLDCLTGQRQSLSHATTGRAAPCWPLHPPCRLVITTLSLLFVFTGQVCLGHYPSIDYQLALAIESGAIFLGRWDIAAAHERT